MQADLANDEGVLYGKQTARALENFPLGAPVRICLIYAITEVKKAMAAAHKKTGLLRPKTADAILRACNRILAGEADNAFPTAALQGGAGTSTHMNVNEVVAALAARELGEKVDPHDEVNKGQSTNDVYPTALRIAAIRLVRQLSAACARLQESLQARERAFASIPKLGRTELMDALPITLGDEFGAYAQAVSRDRWRIYKAEERLRQVNLGGTAVGTGAGAARRAGLLALDLLREQTGIGLARAEYPMDITQNNDVFVEVSGLLKSLAANLMKIANDLRWMNSGPAGGLGEIRLAPLQEGSSMMPGKVNPVLPEMVCQVAVRVMANDLAITQCAANGNFELNAFLPLLADSLLDSLELLCGAIELFRTRCIDLLQPDEAACRAHLDRSIVRVCALVPRLGYDRAAALARESGGDPARLRRLAEQTGAFAPEELNRLLGKRPSPADD